MKKLFKLFQTKCVRDGFSRGIKFFLNEYAEIKISDKFDAFIRNVNFGSFSTIISVTNMMIMTASNSLLR